MVCCSVAVLQLVFVVVDVGKLCLYLYIYIYRYIDIKFFFDFWLGRILNCNTATLQRLGGVGRGLILSNMCLVEDVDGMLLGVRKKSYFCKILMVGWFWKNGCFNLKIK